MKIFLDINKIACYINRRKKKRRRLFISEKFLQRTEIKRRIQDVPRKRKKKKSLDDEFKKCYI